MPSSGFVQTDVLFDAPLVGSATNPDVNPTDTVLCGPYDVRVYGLVSGYVTNPDALQTLTAWVETSWNGSAGWTRVPQFWDLTDIQPGEAPRPFVLDVTPYRYIRLVGTASGLGITAATVKMHRLAGVSGPRGPYQRF